MPSADCHLMARPLPGGDGCCGDSGLIADDGATCFIALIDGLGHGQEAARAAGLAVEYLQANRDVKDTAELMRGLHERLKSSRGAVAFLARLDLATGELRHTGIGNIVAKVFGGDAPIRLSSKDGVVGYMISTPREGVHRLVPRDVLMLSSDGVRDHFETFEHPDLLRGEAKDIAARMLDRFATNDDDASCLVLRYLK